jgi:hypothetical protein
MPRRAAISNEEKLKKLKQRIWTQIRRGAGKGLDAARPFIVSRIKEAMNVSAPKKRVRLPGGAFYYRATTPAEPLAPIRKVSGDAQRSVWGEVVGKLLIIRVTARSKDGFPYPKYHEIVNPKNLGSGKHQFIKPTIAKYKTALKIIVGKSLRLD